MVLAKDDLVPALLLGLSVVEVVGRGGRGFVISMWCAHVCARPVCVNEIVCAQRLSIFGERGVHACVCTLRVC